MSLFSPSNHVPQPPDFQQFMVESGLLRGLAAEARRLDPAQFRRIPDGQLRCSIEDLTDEGHLTIQLHIPGSGIGTDRSPVTRSFEITFQDGRVGRMPLDAQQLAGLARAASYVIENNPRSFGNIRPHVVVTNQHLTSDVLDRLRDLPSRIDIKGPVVDEIPAYFVDEMISNGAEGSARIVGMHQESGVFGLPRGEHDINCYAAQIRSWDQQHCTELHLNSNFVPPLRARLISLLSDGIAQRGCAEMVRYLESLQFQEDVLTPQFLAGAPLAKTTQFLNRFQGLIERESCIADVERAWQQEDAFFWCFGFYPDVTEDLLRFLSAYRYKRDGHSLSLIGVAVSEDTAADLCPADSPEFINRYVCLLDGIQMPTILSFNEHAHTKNFPDEVSRIFQSLVFKLKHEGVDALRDYLGARS